MKHLVIVFILLALGCNKQPAVVTVQQEKPVQLNRSIGDLNKFSIEYTPAEIDLSKNKELAKFDIDYIFNSAKYTDKGVEKDNIARTILLKQYLYHLKNYHQGYDLLSMRRGEAKYLIDYFLKRENVGSREFLNSREAYRLVYKLGNNEYINNLIVEIEREEKELSKNDY